MAIDRAALKSEITTDPAALGYAALVAAGDDAGVAAALNLARAGTAYQQYRGPLPAYQVVNATDPADWAALTAQEKQRYQTLTGAGQVDTSNANLRAMFSAMFPAGSTTRANLTNLALRQGSRAEVLFGPGTTITHADVAAALRGT